MHWTFESHNYNYSWVSLEFISGAIDLAAKSAGIIPGSPCREVEAPSIEKAVVESEEAVESAPAAPELEPDLLDQDPSEVINNPLPRSSFTFGCTVDHILICLFSLSAGVPAEWCLSTFSRGRGLPLGPSQCCFLIGYLSTGPPRGVSSIWRAANSNQRLYYWARHQLALWYDLWDLTWILEECLSQWVLTHFWSLCLFPRWWIIALTS